MNRTAAYSSAVYSAYEAADFSKGDPRSYELDRDLLGKLVVNPSSIPDLPRPWIALTSYDNTSYFFNCETKEHRRTRPSAPKAKSGENSPKDENTNGPEVPDSAAGSDTTAKEHPDTVIDSTISSSAPISASEQSAQDENARGPESFHPAVGPEIGVKDGLKITTDPALVSDVPAGAVDSSPGATLTLPPGSPKLDAIPCGPNLSVPGRTQRSTSFGGQTLVPDDGEDVADDGGDERVESATRSGDYAPAFRLQLRKTTDSSYVSREDSVVGHELQAFDDPKTEQNTIDICFVANDTQMNSVYASQNTVETIIAKYGLQTKLERLSGSPQMGTFQLFEPLGNGDFIFTSRCATTVDASTFLCYRYHASSQSISGLVVDRRERSQVLIDILKTLDLGIGFSLSPAIALAQVALHFNIRAVKALESTYYLNKFLESLTRATAEGPVSKETSVNMLRVLDAMFNGVFGVTGCLEISIKALRALTAMIRDQDKDEHNFDSMLNAIDSETEGHCSVATRTQARTHQRHSIYAASIQTQFLQQTHEAGIKRNKLLDTTRAATATSLKSLDTMRDVLSGTQELNRKTEEVTRVAAEWGKLVFAVTYTTFVINVVSACAELFSMTKWPAKLSSIPMVVINVLCALGFLYLYKRTCTRAKTPESVPQGDKSEEKIDEDVAGKEGC